MRDENCIFCKIANGEIPSATVYEDDQVRVILDLGPAAKGHALVLPKEHFKDSTEAPEALLGHVMAVGAAIGEAAGQSVFHLHLHVIPRRNGDGAVGLWKPGTATPEEMQETAEAVRAAISL